MFTDAYGMGINNPDVRLVIQWDIPLSFDSMIQQMGRAGRKGEASVFILFTPKWTKIKDPDEIEKRINGTSSSTFANAQLSNSNRSKPPSKVSPLSQVVNANEGDLSDSESIASSEADLDIDKGVDLFDLATDVDQDRSQRKKEKKTSQTDVAKCAKLPNKIFDYIHIARCRKLLSLAWYNDMTYTQSEDTKELPVPCCNGPSCNSIEPDFIQQESFIDTTNPPIIETDQEWMAC